ncbi:MAG: hypothetical protein ACF8MJ_09615 [Phycisphaerales bacterium JB050]
MNCRIGTRASSLVLASSLLLSVGATSLAQNERGHAMLTAQTAAALEVSALETFRLDRVFDLDPQIRQIRASTPFNSKHSWSLRTP